MRPVLLVILLCLVGIGTMITTGICLQYRRYRGKYQAIARSLCDPGTWHISFHVRTLLLTGRVDGRVMRYSVLGDERGNGPVSSYLLLEWPVQRNLRFYSGGDLNLLDPDARDNLALLRRWRAFRGSCLPPRRRPGLPHSSRDLWGSGVRPAFFSGNGAATPSTRTRSRAISVCSHDWRRTASDAAREGRGLPLQKAFIAGSITERRRRAYGHGDQEKIRAPLEEIL